MNKADTANQHMINNTSNTVLLPPAYSAITVQKLPQVAVKIIQQNFAELLAEARLDAEQHPIDVDMESGNSYPSAQQGYLQDLLCVDRQCLIDIVADLNGLMDCAIAGHILDDLVFYQGRLAALPEFGVYHYFRAKRHVKDHNNILASTLYWGEHAHLLGCLDLRQIADVLHQSAYCDKPEQLIAECFLNGQLPDVYQVWQNDLIWPFFVQYPEYLDEILGLSPKKHSRTINLANAQQKALRLLQCFPQIPAPYVPKLLDWALSDGKAWKHQAQVVLAKHPTAHEYAIAALAAKKPPTRHVAAKWLCALQHPASIAPLYAALAQEKQVLIRMAMLSALLQQGENLNDYFSPKALWDIAQKALKSSIPDYLAWLKPETIPALTWQNQQAADANIAYGLIILAAKNQDAAGNAFLHHCLLQFSPSSQQALAVFILSAFIQEDLRCPSAEEALAMAVIDAPQQWQEEQDLYQGNLSDFGHYANKTLAMVVDTLQQEKMATPYTSAIDCLGILALCRGIDAATAIHWVAPYLQQQTQRKTQRHALLKAIGYCDGDNHTKHNALMVSFLLTQQAHYPIAAERLTAMATRHGLKPPQLADAFIPIPQNATEQQIFGDEQSSRLFHAMCAQKTWSVADWQRYYVEHALMKTLIHRLVWLNIDAQGAVLQSFRIDAQGKLLNAQGQPITLFDHSRIQLAHGLLLPEQTRQEWQGFWQNNNNNTPLFEQFNHLTPIFTALKKGRLIKDYLGYVLPHNDLQTRLLAKGYQACASDQGYFYAKHCPDLDLYAAICVSHIQGFEDNPQAGNSHETVCLYDLCFFKALDWPHPLLIDAIAPIFLAECHADYLALAESGTGLHAKYARFGSL